MGWAGVVVGMWGSCGVWGGVGQGRVGSWWGRWWGLGVGWAWGWVGRDLWGPGWGVPWAGPPSTSHTRGLGCGREGTAVPICAQRELECRRPRAGRQPGPGPARPQLGRRPCQLGRQKTGPSSGRRVQTGGASLAGPPSGAADGVHLEPRRPERDGRWGGAPEFPA